MCALCTPPKLPAVVVIVVGFFFHLFFFFGKFQNYFFVAGQVGFWIVCGLSLGG